MTSSIAPVPRLVDQFERGLDAPICLTWELTYACNLSCVHCLSSSGKRDPRELSTRQCMDIIDELERMQVFYVNIGGGEPTVRPDFWELVDYATAHHVGVKFSTNGVRITPEVAAKLAASDYVDVQISLDGATADVNDEVRGPGSYAMAIRALENLAAAGFRDAKISVVVTRHNVDQLDDFKALADQYGATLRITRLRPSGRGADVWDELHPTAQQQVQLYDWLVARGDNVLTGDSFFHLSGLGEPGALAGLNLCGAGRVVCLIDPIGDVYACPFAIHDKFLAGNILRDGGFDHVWKYSSLFRELREPQSAGACTGCGHYDACRGGCMAAKFFTGLPLDGPDPECVQGFGEPALARERDKPKSSVDHSRSGGRKGPIPLKLLTMPPEKILQRKSRLNMARDKWFETVAIAQERAKKRLPKSAYSSLISASEKGLTVADNVEAFGQLGFAPHVIGAQEKRDLATTVMGQDISLPVIISPTGVQAVHPDGEVAVARAAAAARGTAMGLSSFASKPIEEVIAVNPKVFFQIYWLGDRDAIAARVERARAAGAVGLIATTDWSFSHGRDWGSPKIPERMDLKTILKMSPEVITKPRWFLQWAKTLRPPALSVPNQGAKGEAGPPFFQAYGEWMGTPPPTWEDIAWLRDLWGGPFMLKGVMRVDDAKRAVDAGVSAISVSNHGGNNLDSTPASIRALPAIAEAVGDQIEVLLDGGIRRGSDVVKALAFGARAVMIGRAYLWGLAAEGEEGVANVLDILQGGIDSALRGLGKASIHDLVADDVLTPPGFARALGVPRDR